MRYKLYSLAKRDQVDDTNELLTLFHHIHHNGGEHEVHHCGGAHTDADYTVLHCKCGKHSIDKQIAIGHATDDKTIDPAEIEIQFAEKCPSGGWHVESGVVAKRVAKNDDAPTWGEICGKDLNATQKDTQ